MENEKQLFGALKQHVELGLASMGGVHGSLSSDELSDLQRELRDKGFVEYYLNWSGERETYGPLWLYDVTKEGLKFYDKMRGAVK
jgi:hypothetical protein